MSDVPIREATEADIPTILRLYGAAGIDDKDHFTVAEASAHLAALKQYPSFRVFVACADQVVVGTYELLIMDNMAKRGRRSGIVEDVAVDPQYQGRGVSGAP